MNRWLDWAKQIRAISQTGTHYASGVYDLERYRQLDAIAHEMMSLLADAPVEKIANFFVPDSGYATPKVDLRAGVFRDGEILLVRESTDNRWALPGGWADVCESPRQGIEREAFEESGYRVKATRLVAVKDRSLHDYQPQYPDHLFKLFFLCELIDGTPTPSIETTEIGFFSPQALPEMSVERVLPADVELLWDHYNNPSLPAYFD